MTEQVTLDLRPRAIAARVRSWFLGLDDDDLAYRSEATPGAGPAALADPAARLRESWRRHSLSSGWISPADWWDPACDAAVEALLSDLPTPAPMARLGQVRAELGCTIEESMDDLAALYAAAGADGPPLPAVRALAGGWAESGLREVGAASCFDPVTGLASRAHLEARLCELYRDRRPGHPAERLCLVVVDVDAPTALAGLPSLHRTSEALRRTFTQGCILARIGQGRFAAVAPIGPALPCSLEALESLLADTDEHDTTVAAVWVESLPRTYRLVHGLLEDLSR